MLKPAQIWRIAEGFPAAFRRLCVETTKTAKTRATRATAAFRRLCVETIAAKPANIC